ncbi:MAG: hypothetical protein WAU61_01885, partial [Smithella sp.]
MAKRSKNKLRDSNNPQLTVLTPIDAEQSKKFSGIITFAETFANKWPIELSRNEFKKVDLDKLMTRLADYVRRNYPSSPGGIFKSSSKPEYEFVGDLFGRVADPVQDIKLVQAATLLKGSKINSQNPLQMIEEYGTLATKVIVYYSQTTLAKFLFLLPTAAKTYEETAQGVKSTFSEAYA